MENSKYTIFFSTKWYKIRINQQSILDIGYPKRLRILINPEKKEMVVQPCNKYEKLAFKVPNDFGDTSHGFELSSAKLTGLIVDTMGWTRGVHYRICGKYIEEENIIVFPLTQYEIMAGEEIEENES